jgi:hypothetical protein
MTLLTVELLFAPPADFTGRGAKGNSMVAWVLSVFFMSLFSSLINPTA